VNVRPTIAVMERRFPTWVPDGLGTLSVPVVQTVAWLALSAVAGVVAAALPARTAARLDVLRAISYE
jgi:hypothetical protein